MCYHFLSKFHKNSSTKFGIILLIGKQTDKLCQSINSLAEIREINCCTGHDIYKGLSVWVQSRLDPCPNDTYIHTGNDKHIIKEVQTEAATHRHYHSSRNSNPDFIVPLLLVLSGCNDKQNMFNNRLCPLDTKIDNFTDILLPRQSLT